MTVCRIISVPGRRWLTGIALFVDIPHPSISYIYQSTGCQHSLQPGENDFAAPSIPALTIKGFVRWQSIEILLGPEEHVPFMQTAVRDFGIKNPDTGEVFSPDLPKEAFPVKPDEGILEWHGKCADRLRENMEPDGDAEHSRPTLPPRPRVKTGFQHVRVQPSGRGRGEPASYQVPFQHVRPPMRPESSQVPREQVHLAPDYDSERTSRSRRQTLPESYYFAQPPVQAVAGLNILPEGGDARRHSVPRPRRRDSLSSASSEDGGSRSVSVSPIVASRRPRLNHDQFRHTVQISQPLVGRPPAGQIPPIRPRDLYSNPVSRQGSRDPAFTIPVNVDPSGKLSAPFLPPVSSNRPPRSNSRGTNVRWAPVNQVSEFKRRGSMDTETTDDSHDRRGSRERDRRRFRENDEISRPRLVEARRRSFEDRERDRRDREYQRDRERDRDYGRERERGRRDDKKGKQNRFVSPVTGVDGRRYPTDAFAWR